MGKEKTTIDGNTAAAHVAYAYSEVAAIYPITPSSPMGELADDWAANSRKNIFGQIVSVVELQSEGGASGAVHGSLAAGALTSTFTAAQGLLLMIPNMYKIAGELLPAVFHVSARTVASHALSIFGDHSDVMATRQTGFAFTASGSIQEVHDIAIITHLSAIESSIPFLHFFDGFRTSHEVQKVEILDYEELAKLVDYEAIKKFKERALNPEHPITRGTAQNPDVFFQNREACNPYYLKIPAIVENVMKRVSKALGRNYNLFDYVGVPDAEHIIIAMGSSVEAIEETVEYLNKKGEKVGLVKVRLYRPFSVEHFLKVIPKSVKIVSVLDRTKEPGSIGEPLYQDIVTAFSKSDMKPIILGGRYGLSSKEFNPAMIKAIFDNMKINNPKNHFTVGIVDDVTNTSLEVKESINTEDPKTKRCKFWGLGADGTVGASKNSIKIIGDYTDMYAQGYFVYDSKKSGGITISHLRFGPKPIKSTYLLTESDFISCNHPSYVTRYDILDGIIEGGVFLLNSEWSAKDIEIQLPSKLKKIIAQKKVKFFNINAFKLAEEIGLGGRINSIMQSAFFKLTNIIPFEDAVKYMKEAILYTYGAKGEDIVKMNYASIDKGGSDIVEMPVPKEWANLPVEKEKLPDNWTTFVKDVACVINKLHGDDLPVSAFSPDGSFPNSTTQYEKRGIAINLPKWIAENCIQCNQCTYVCPHSVIRAFLFEEKDIKDAPKTFNTLAAIGIKEPAGLKYRIQISSLDCTGCGNCSDVCPGKKNVKALEIVHAPDIMEQEDENWKYAISKPRVDNPLSVKTLKGSQFNFPLFEYHGACGGCGETPYIKVLTQVFGEQMLIANATGCSSIYGGTAPSQPYTVNKDGFGPAWANSLFEDNAEYGFGFRLAIDQIRCRLEELAKKAITFEISAELKEALKNWIEKINDFEESGKLTKKIKRLLPDSIKSAKNDESKAILSEIKGREEYLAKKSVWVIGGDGWAYDIGYGGLDHIMAMNRDVNVLVLDTEVYSNTGGQASKATQMGAIAKFAAAGKSIRKKDLGLMLVTYGYVYVAQVCMGANRNQYLKAILEAESYPGPSIIIAYSPCIAHGIRAGMGLSQREGLEATECGYWPIYRYDPRLELEGKNPFQLDGPKELNGKFQDFLKGEVRFNSLKKLFPDRAKWLFVEAEKDMKKRFNTYRKMAGLEPMQ